MHANEKDDQVNSVWEDFWKPLVCAKNGEIVLDSIKRELYDYYVVMNEVSEAYCHITGNIFSKANTKASHIIEAAETHYREYFSGSDDMEKCDEGFSSEEE
jgi:hypothetical protein